MVDEREARNWVNGVLMVIRKQVFHLKCELIKDYADVVMYGG